jgi:DNA-binding LacI/PurR family transcriptional regulator
MHTEPVNRLVRSGYPSVLVDRYLRGVSSDYVMSDHFGGALRATKHLIELGHQRIGFVSWRDPSISMEHRATGYQRGLIEAGLSYDPALTCEVEGYPTVALDPLHEYLKRKPGVTAIFAANDQLALAVYQAARQMGIQIPQDMALVGFDNLDFTMHLDVPLTTVAQPAFELGRHAVLAAVRRMNHEIDGWQQEILPTQLIIRRSCGAYLKDGMTIDLLK